MDGWLIALGIAAAGFLLALAKKLGDSALQFLGGAIADKLVDTIGEHLQPQWLADIDDILDEQLRPIRDELTPNHGSSMKDHVTVINTRLSELQRAVETHITGQRFRGEEIEGTPI